MMNRPETFFSDEFIEEAAKVAWTATLHPHWPHPTWEEMADTTKATFRNSARAVLTWTAEVGGAESRYWYEFFEGERPEDPEHMVVSRDYDSAAEAARSILLGQSLHPNRTYDLIHEVAIKIPTSEALARYRAGQ
jgi:hypothetical protein